MTAFSDFSDQDIAHAVWRLIAPNHQGEQGIEGGVGERAIIRAAYEGAMLGQDYTGPINNRDVVAVHQRLVEMVAKGRLIDAAPGWRTPTAPEDAMYRLTMKGAKHTYSFRGSEHHAAKETCATLADLTGNREDYLEALFVAPLAVGKAAKIGRLSEPLVFIVERST